MNKFIQRLNLHNTVTTINASFDNRFKIHLQQDILLLLNRSKLHFTKLYDPVSLNRTESMGSAIIFTRTRETSNKLSLLLRQFLNTPVITLNGDMPQAQRLGALSKFKRLPASVLVATDVASRLVPLIF